jgi:ATP synthase protein I
MEYTDSHIDRFFSSDLGESDLAASDQNHDEDAALKARLAELSGSLEAKRAASAKGGLHDDAGAASSGAATGKAMTAGLRVVSELVAGVIVGALLGWQFDKWLGTAPFALIGMLILGTASGFWNVYRLAARPSSPRPDDGR